MPSKRQRSQGRVSPDIVERSFLWAVLITYAENAARERQIARSVFSLPAAHEETPWTTSTKTEAFQTSQTKSKVKTRPSEVDSIAEQTKVLKLDTDELASKEETIAVRESSLNIFMRMFSPHAEAQAPVKWKALVAALSDAGLSTMHNGGSVVTFAHESKGTIAIHEPHPGTEVDFAQLRWIGKRLEKWFRWDAGSFVLQK